MPTFSAELVARKDISPRVVGMTFHASAPLVRAAGQYVMLTLDEGSTHAFSVSSPFEPDRPARFEIAVARGTSAGAVLELELGAVVSVTGPSGSLVWRADAPALLVATGTGISPLRALVHEQLARASSTPLYLLFGCQDSEEELWGAEFAALAAQHGRFRFWPTHSRPSPGYTGRIGRVQAYLPELAKQLGPSLRAYLCGHTPMVRDCTTILLDLGVAPEHVHGESY